MTASELKKSILQMAVEGKLTEQSKKDEPVEKLLKRIKEEKENLIKEGKIKKYKTTSEIYKKDGSYYESIAEGKNILKDVCIDDELPFEIPDSWAWVRLNTLSINYDNMRKPVSVEIRSKQRKVYDYYGATGAIDKVDSYIFDGIFILIGEDGGNFYSDKDVAFIIKGKFWANNHVHVLGIYKGCEYYFCNFLNSLNLPAMGLINGIAVPKLNQSNLNKILIPLPPIEEQKRIVEKINLLMPLINEYDSLEKNITKLNKEFPNSIKKSILQYAIEGKLTEQSEKDEPVEKLLKRIKEEREKLIKEGKIKKDKTTSEIYKKDGSYYERITDGKNILKEVCIDDELPFEIPDSWGWVRFNNIVSYSMGKTPPRKENEYWDNATFPWVSIADLIPDSVLYETKEKVNKHSAEKIFKNRISTAGTLLMSFKLTVGKVSILGIDAFHNEAIISIYPFIDTDKIVTNYLFLIMPLISQSGDTKTAIKGNTLNTDSLNALYIPLPPIEEQGRIADKINRLNEIINTIKI